MTDYTEVIQMIAEIIKIGIPIGLVIGLAEWSVKFFIKCALGRWKDNG